MEAIFIYWAMDLKNIELFIMIINIMLLTFPNFIVTIKF